MLISPLIALMGALLLSSNGPTYTVVDQFEDVQVRAYDAWIVAETVVEATMEEAGNKAFHILGGYIFGNNEGGVKIEMTAPVTQQEVSVGRYAVQFMMPKEWTLETLPKPKDSSIQLKQIPARKLLAERYNGGWSENKFEENMLKALKEAREHKVTVDASKQPIWARYNSPMAPTFLRTNEVLFELA